jgi:hypothetical protein
MEKAGRKCPRIAIVVLQTLNNRLKVSKPSVEVPRLVLGLPRQLVPE